MEKRLGEMEGRFADLIWKNAPIASGKLAQLCEKEFKWKRTTTYTMLKRLIDRGLFCNENGLVSVRMEREAFYAQQGTQLLDAGFGGSLPRFVAAFTSGRPLKQEEIAQLRELIDAYDPRTDDE